MYLTPTSSPSISLTRGAGARLEASSFGASEVRGRRVGLRFRNLGPPILTQPAQDGVLAMRKRWPPEASRGQRPEAILTAHLLGDLDLTRETVDWRPW